MTCKQEIIELLRKFPNGLAGGRIEDTIRDNIGAKASTVSRRCREMADDKILAYAYWNGYVYYKLNKEYQK